jgi:hypothetical protein
MNGKQVGLIRSGAVSWIFANVFFTAGVAGCATGCSAVENETRIAALRDTIQIEQPTQDALKSILLAELQRLGKSTSQTTTGPPSGTDNDPFDFCVMLIDPDGEGGNDSLGVELSWTERLVGDYNNDGVVNMYDITPLGQHFGETIEYRDPAKHEGVTYWPQYYPEWAPPDHALDWVLARIDGNGDGILNASDLTPIAQHWMEELAGYRFYYQAPPLNQWFPIAEPGNPQKQIELPRRYPPERASLPIGAATPQDPAHYRLKTPTLTYADSSVALVPFNATGDEGSWSTRPCLRDHPSWFQCNPPQYDETYFWQPAGPFDARAVLVDQEMPSGEVTPAVLLSWTERLRADGDLSGTVTVFDIIPLGSHYGEQITYLNFYNDDYGISSVWPVGDPAGAGRQAWLAARADYNNDTLVGVADLTQVGVQMFTRLDGYFIYGRPAYQPEFARLPSPTDAQRPLVVSRPFGDGLDYVPSHKALLPPMNEGDWVGIAPICFRGTDGDEGAIYPVPVWQGAISAPYGGSDPVVAILAASNSHPHQGEEITICAWSSYSAQGGIASYEWDINGAGVFDPPEQLPFKQAIYYHLDEVSPAVRVTNDDGQMAETSITLDVGEPIPYGIIVGAALHDPLGVLTTVSFNVEVTLYAKFSADSREILGSRSIACVLEQESVAQFDPLYYDGYVYADVELGGFKWVGEDGQMSEDFISVRHLLGDTGAAYIALNGYAY